MSTQVATLAAALIAAAASVLTLLLNSRLTYSRERRQIVLRKEVDRFFELEELAGILVERVGNYRSFESERDAIGDLLLTLEVSAGKFARYPRVNQAARDLHNVCARLFVDRRDHADDRETRGELLPAYHLLLDAVDGVIAPRPLHNRRLVATRSLKGGA